MAKKIKIVGSALVIEDTITSEVILDRPSKDMYYNSESLDTGTVILLEKEGPSNTYINKLTLPLINVVDSLDVAFTAETFRTFAREELGFKIAGSTALTTSRYRTRVFEDGGTLEGLSTLRYEIDKATNKGRSVPSLLMIPSGKKENILHSVLPINGSGDFTVVRDSPVWAMGQDGYLVETPPNVPCFEWLNGKPHLLPQLQSINLIAYSNDFSDASWIKNNSNIFNFFNSPTNELTAFKIENKTGTQAYLRVPFTCNIGNSYSGSCFIKKDIANFCFLRALWVAGNPVSYFDLDNGVLGTIPNGIVAKIESFNDNWYRCSISGLADKEVSFFDIGIASYDNSDRISELEDTMYVYGAQLEPGTTATSYMKAQGTPVTRLADDITVVPPVGVTEIIETINGVENPPITVIPEIYQVPVGSINKIIMK